MVICGFKLQLLWEPVVTAMLWTSRRWVVSLRFIQKVCGGATGRAEVDHSSSTVLSHSLCGYSHLRKIALKMNVLFHGYSHTLQGWCQFFKSPPSFVPWRQLTTIEHHLIQLGHCCVSATWEEWGPLPGLCSAFASRPETSHPFQLQVFFLCTVGEFSTRLSVSVKQSILPFCLAFYYVNAV